MAIELNESTVKLSYDVLGEEPLADIDNKNIRMSVTSMLIEIEYTDSWTVTLRGVAITESGRKTKTKASVTFGPDEVGEMPVFAQKTFDKVMSEIKGIFA